MGQPVRTKRTTNNRKTSSPRKSIPENQPSPFLTALNALWLRFRRFSLDILGVLLIALTLMTILGMLGLTSGTFIDAWVPFLQRWFGWGSFLILLAAMLLSLFLLKNHIKLFPKIVPAKLFGLELILFLLLTIMAMIGGSSLERAEQGKDGGIIGWGLAEGARMLFPDGLDWFIILFFIAALLFYVFDIGSHLLRLLRGLDSRISAIQKKSHRVDGMSENIDIEGELTLATESGGSTTEAKGAKKSGISSHDVFSVKRPHTLPGLEILLDEITYKFNEENIHNTASQIEQALFEFGIPARVIGYRVGPTITQFAVEPGYVEKTAPDGSIQKQKIRVSQIQSLQRDLALALSAERMRIEAPVPGQSFVGIEVPNIQGELVRLKPLLQSQAFQKAGTPLAIAIGKDVSGQAVIADLSRMPHLLIAGTTGSGKSVAIASITFCLAMNNQPKDLRLIMLDPKMVELIRFNGLPHILGKVETNPERIIGVLRWALSEMDRRYRLLEQAKTRDIDTYNRKISRQNGEKLPKIVILIDELADLMMSAPDQTEHSIVRLAQMARATGIHLVIATQRPSTDVITGLIKANFPARISFSVASSVDSRVILDTNGAETLLGRGDMLFLPPEASSPIRTQGVMVSDQEIENLINFWREAALSDIVPPPWEGLIEDEKGGTDSLMDQAISIVRKSQRASASLLQRRLRIGYPRAARLIDELEEEGIIGPNLGGGKDRDVLIPPVEEDEELFEDE